MIKQRQPASSKTGSVVVTVDRNQLGRNLLGSNPTSWTKLVMDMYPPGTSVRYECCALFAANSFIMHIPNFIKGL